MNYHFSILNSSLSAAKIQLFHELITFLVIFLYSNRNFSSISCPTTHLPYLFRILTSH